MKITNSAQIYITNPTKYKFAKLTLQYCDLRTDHVKSVPGYLDKIEIEDKQYFNLARNKS